VNWLDAVLGAGTVWWMLRRWRRGFVSAALELGGAALGLGMALGWAGALAAWLEAVGGVPTGLGRPAMFVVLTLPPAVLGHWAGQAAAARARDGGRWNRVAGALLGLGEAVAIAGIAMVAWVQWGGSLYAPALVDSFLAGWLLRLAPALYQWLAEVLPV